MFLESFSHLLNSDPWRIYLGSTWKVSTMVRCVSAGYDPLKSFCRLLQPLTLDLEFNDVTQVFLRIQSHCKKTRRQRQLMCTDAHRQEASLKMAHQKTFRICQARNRQESQAARDLNQKHMPWLSGRQGLGLGTPGGVCVSLTTSCGSVSSLKHQKHIEVPR